MARGDFPGYQRIRLEPVAYFREGGRLGVHLPGQTAPGPTSSTAASSPHPTQAYGMWWSTPDGHWNASLDALHLIQRTFKPAQ